MDALTPARADRGLRQGVRLFREQVSLFK